MRDVREQLDGQVVECRHGTACRQKGVTGAKRLEILDRAALAGLSLNTNQLLAPRGTLARRSTAFLRRLATVNTLAIGRDLYYYSISVQACS